MLLVFAWNHNCLKCSILLFRRQIFLRPVTHLYWSSAGWKILFFNSYSCFTRIPQRCCLAILSCDVLEEMAHVGDILAPLLLLGTNHTASSSGVNSSRQWAVGWVQSCRQISALLVACTLMGRHVKYFYKLWPCYFIAERLALEDFYASFEIRNQQ